MTYYRLRADWREIKAGTLLFPWRASSTKIASDCVALSERPDGWGSQLEIKLEDLETSPDPKAGEFEALLRYYMVGAVIPPNLEIGTDATLHADLSGIAHAGSMVGSYASIFGGRIMLPSMREGKFPKHYGEIAFAVASRTQGGELDGSAKVLIYRPTWGKDETPRTASFRLCLHNKLARVVGAGARPERGWHPGRCSYCGLDMSVDSGD